MYALIKSGMFVGIFSSKKTMRIVIEAMIKDQYQTNGYNGDYHFQYIKFNPDEPWITKTGESAPEETKALLSLSTIHPEKFIHKVKTDWSTGEILDMDADTTNNLKDTKNLNDKK